MGVALALVRQSRPQVWPVTLVPLWVGRLLAAKRIELDLELVVAAFSLGPLAWSAALWVNDVHDVETDRANPRKATSPVVQRVVSEQALERAAWCAAAAAVIVACAVGLAFAGLTVLFLALAWCYSAPPLRLKARPGMDVATNAVAAGVVPLLAGWSTVRPLSSFPGAMALEGMAVAAALYIPSVLVDFGADDRAGVTTVATGFGRELAYRLGWWAWVAANAGAVVLCLADVLPRELLPYQAVFVPVLLLAYHVMIGRARSSIAIHAGIVAVSAAFLGPTLALAWIYGW